MEFTGERVVPGRVEPDLFNEHLSRYYFAQSLIAQKSVLDLGCGSGYGSAILATSAKSVFAVDISEEAVGFARGNYSAPNLSFLVADCARLSLVSGSVDAVVSFELIEHLPEPEQKSLLEEVQRVLRPDGFLLISTPNRVFYTEERKEINPFHAHEFNFEEFSTCLKSYFQRVEVYYQNHISSIFIGNPPLSLGIVCRFGENIQGLEPTSNFFVAICSRTGQNWPTVENLVYIPSTGNLLREKGQYIQHLESRINELDAKVLNFQKEYDKRTEWCLELDQQVKTRDATIVDLQRELEERTAWANRLSQQILEKDDRILELQNEFDERTQWALTLDSDLKICQERLKGCQRQLDRIKQSRFFKVSKSLRLVPKP